MKQKLFILFLVLIPVVYLLFVLKYIPKTLNSSYQSISDYFGTNTFEGTTTKKNIFNFKKI